MIKKIAILSTVLLSLNSAVFAADWIRLNITNSTKYIYLDHDSISKDDNNLFYVIRYKNDRGIEKVAYIKYSLADEKIGIVKLKDYNSEKYKSDNDWKNSFAFMKELGEDSFCNNINNFVQDDKMVQKLNAERELRQQTTISSNKELIKKYSEKYPGMGEYIVTIEGKIRKNWKLPVTNSGGVAKVQFKINREGKLTLCEIKQSSGNKENDNSAREAVKNTEPFEHFPDTAAKDLKEINILMTFDYYVLDVNKK